MANGVKFFIIPLFALFLISSCKTLNTKLGKGAKTGIAERVILANEAGKKIRICTEPSPDATQEFLLKALVEGEVKLPGQDTEGEGKGEVTIDVGQDYVGLRTQSIQLLRDAMFRACEAYLNEGINEDEYYALLRRHQKTMMGLIAIESLTGTVRASDLSASLQRELADVSRRIMEIDHILKEKSDDTTQEQVDQLEEERKDLRTSQKNLRTALANAHQQSSSTTDTTSEDRGKIAVVVENIATELIRINDSGVECFNYLSSGNKQSSDTGAHQVLLEHCRKYFKEGGAKIRSLGNGNLIFLHENGDAELLKRVGDTGLLEGGGNVQPVSKKEGTKKILEELKSLSSEEENSLIENTEIE